MIWYGLSDGGGPHERNVSLVLLACPKHTILVRINFKIFAEKEMKVKQPM
jgi:hypothetical protein